MISRETIVANMKRCPLYHKDGTCLDINLRLGWRSGVREETCQKCLSCGGPFGKESTEFRIAKAGEIVEAMLKPDILPKLGRDILVPLLLKHRRLDPAICEDTAFSREVRWMEASKSFEEAGHFQRGTLKDFLKAKWSLLTWAPISPETLKDRQDSCASCPSFTLSANGFNHYCNECGCGDREDAYLDAEINGFTKLHYPYLKCPRKRKGFSNAILTVNGTPSESLPADRGHQPQAAE